MRSLIVLRIVYGLAVACGVAAAISTLVDVKQVYRLLVQESKNGPSLFLAHSHVRNAWQILYVQVALLAILILGAFIPIHPWHEEGAVYRMWITILHTSMTLMVTWKSICVRRDRHILADMVRLEESRKS